MEKQVILNEKHLELTLKRLCHELIETHNDFSETVIIGLQPRGIHVVQRLKFQLGNILSKEITCGSLDITFYRDDFRRREIPLIPSITNIDFSIENKNIILVDDVLNSGKTLMYAAKHFLTTPLIRLAIMVLVDRNHNRYPIKADYIGLSLATTLQEYINVKLKGADKGVYLS